MADDDEFEKELSEMAHGGFPGGDDKGDDDDDVFGENSALFDDLGEDDEDDVPPPPSDDPDDDDDFPDGNDDSNDNFEEEILEGDEDADEPLSDFMDTYGEDDDEEEYYEDEDEDADVDAETSGFGKGKMIFWGAVSTLALAVGAVGYFAVVPMLTGGGSQPSQPASSYEQQSRIDAGYSPSEEREPVSIPGENGAGEPGEAPSGLPSMPGGDNGTGSGMPSLGGSNEADAPSRPGLGAEESGNVSLDTDGSSEGAGMPQLQMPDPGSGTDDDDGPSNPTATGEAQDETDQPDTSGETDAGADLSNVLSKLDDMITRLDQFEDDVMTEDATRDLVNEIVERKIDAADMTSGSDTGSAEMEALKRSVDAMTERVAEMESTRESVSELEARIAELMEKVNATEEAGAEEDQAEPGLKMPNVSDLNSDADAAEDEDAESEEATKTAEASNPDQTEAEATRLRRELEAKKRELAAVNAKGRDVHPPARPHMFTDYRLAGVSNDLAWIETPTGVSMFGVGQDVPGAGRIRELRKMNGNFAVITSNGVIIP